jgi:TPR repeat protein
MFELLSSWKWLLGMHLRARLLNDPGAQYGLGASYATGDFDTWQRSWQRPKNERAALRWYSAAAEQGHVEAQYNLGFMLLLGEGTAPDASAALRWLERAAQRGSNDAAKLLSDLYDGWGQERGVARDLERAAYWRARVER